ncbi:hypothetical protein SLS58_002987 [Diplodia intermedia]|uniref:ORC6 first cyclin-like domain-containing protein n=1 Tax=Diplodia intermedia TaxID=856260 RepID=A0ABR3TXQ0_9PEZI
MSKPIEQALVGLVPAHNGPLPPELLNTAVSLLAQSRNKASSLRPEEEIARTYVCAHLACESAARNGDNDDDGIVPSYVTPLIRALCRALGAPGAAVPHVYAGVRSILREGAAAGSDNKNTTPSRSSARNKRRSSGGATAAATTTMEKVEERDIPPLIAVLLMYTMIKLGGRPTSAAELRERRERAVEVVWGECEACEGWWGTEEELVRKVEKLLVEAKERGWLDMEWFGNVVQGDADVEMGDEDGDEEGDTEEDEGGAGVPPTPYTPLKKRKTKTVDVQAGVSQGGLGTMMQDKVDYLSEARRAGFVKWKAGIMKRVERIEREDGQAMDVSA